MEEVSIVWEYPDGLPEPYKGWAEDIIREHLHPYVFPVPKSYTGLKHLFLNAKLGELPPDFEKKFEGYVSDINKWLDESAGRIPDSPPRQFTSFEDLLLHFKEYFIRDLAERERKSMVLLDVIGRYRSKDYHLGKFVFINQEDIILLDFFADFRNSREIYSSKSERDLKVSISPCPGAEKPLVHNPETGEIIA